MSKKAGLGSMLVSPLWAWLRSLQWILPTRQHPPLWWRSRRCASASRQNSRTSSNPMKERKKKDHGTFHKEFEGCRPSVHQLILHDTDLRLYSGWMTLSHATLSYELPRGPVPMLTKGLGTADPVLQEKLAKLLKKDGWNKEE